MIPRYTNPEMGAIWSDQRRYETWLEVELAAADAMAEAGVIPADAARELRAKARFDVARIEEIEQVTQHDVIAFTTAVAEHVGPAARWLHFGLTSSDVLDTAQAIQMRAGVRPDRQGSRDRDGRGPDARRGTSADADDRPHPRRPRRADDPRRQARAVVRRAAACRGSRAAGARRRQRGKDLRRGRDVRAPRSARSRRGCASGWDCSRRRCRRR